MSGKIVLGCMCNQLDLVFFFFANGVVVREKKNREWDGSLLPIQLRCNEGKCMLLCPLVRERWCKNVGRLKCFT